MVRKILIAIDGSMHSKKALEFACDLVDKYNSDLHILHVVESTPRDSYMAMGSSAVKIPPSRDELEAAGKEIIAAAVEISKDQCCTKVTTEIQGGSAAECILESIEHNNIDMVVLGSRGLNDLTGLLLGSVSHKVSHLANCTCVTVR